MPTVVADRLISWASDIEPGTLAQAHRAARLPIVHSHVALMPDAHIGIGATVGSVIPTLGAIIPSAVGVDIGCGMIVVETDLDQGQLPDRIDPLLDRIARTVPAGVGRGRTVPTRRGDVWLANHRPASDLTPRQARAASDQLGSLGSGNHFLEVCVDERGRVWVVLHSGSRGVGNQLATRHIAEAKASFAELVTGGALEDPDLAWFVQGTEAFDRYVRDMLWAQDYALENREIMMDRTLREVFAFVGHGREQRRINCHHNFAVPEEHGGVQVWVTRKGAIRAQQGDLGVIPGSMGAKTYIVRGKGNAVELRFLQPWSGTTAQSRRGQAGFRRRRPRGTDGRQGLAEPARRRPGRRDP